MIVGDGRGSEEDRRWTNRFGFAECGKFYHFTHLTKLVILIQTWIMAAFSFRSFQLYNMRPADSEDQLWGSILRRTSLLFSYEEAAKIFFPPSHPGSVFLLFVYALGVVTLIYYVNKIPNWHVLPSAPARAVGAPHHDHVVLPGNWDLQGHLVTIMRW